MKLKYVKALVAVTVALGVLLPSTISHAKSFSGRSSSSYSSRSSSSSYSGSYKSSPKSSYSSGSSSSSKNPRRLTIHHHRFRLKRSLQKRQAPQALKNRQAPFPALHQK